WSHSPPRRRGILPVFLPGTFGTLIARLGANSRQGADMIRDHALDLLNPTPAIVPTIETRIARAIDETLASFPDPELLSAEEQRRVIARYTAVLEGNFI